MRIVMSQQEELARLEEERLLTYVEPDFTPREWKSLGSESEIDSQWREESSGSRPLIRVQVTISMTMMMSAFLCGAVVGFFILCKQHKIVPFFLLNLALIYMCLVCTDITSPSEVRSTSSS